MYSEHKCWEYFRFRKADIPILLHELQFPVGVDGMVHVDNDPADNQRRVVYSFQPMEVLCTFLWRMAYPGTWDRSLEVLGGRSATSYKYAFRFVMDHIYDNFRHCITDISRWNGNCETWAQAIHDAGAPAPRCIGFIDGTFRPSAHMRRRWPSGWHLYVDGCGVCDGKFL